MFAVAGLAAAASWSVLHHSWAGLGQAAVVLAVLLVVVRVLARRDDDLRSLRRAMAREHVLSELGTALITATEVAQVHRLAVRAAGTLLAESPGARATVLGVDAGTLTVTEAAGADADELRGSRMPADTAPAGLLDRLTAGEVVEVADLATLGYAHLSPMTERPYTLLPLVHHDRFFGVLSVSARADLPVEVFQSLQALRTQVAMALASVALTAELTERATRDPLTGLGNRAILRERLTAALARARRTGKPVGALLLDLNGFKQVNDVHGHTAGDQLLKVVAQRLRDSTRTEDLVCRLGGDEFVVIAEDLTSARDVTVIAERIVAALDEPIEMGRKRLRTPAGIGIALSHADITGPDELLRMADTAMYAAKRRGGGYLLHGAAEPVPALS